MFLCLLLNHVQSINRISIFGTRVEYNLIQDIGNLLCRNSYKNDMAQILKYNRMICNKKKKPIKIVMPIIYFIFHFFSILSYHNLNITIPLQLSKRFRWHIQYNSSTIYPFRLAVQRFVTLLFLHDIKPALLGFLPSARKQIVVTHKVILLTPLYFI